MALPNALTGAFSKRYLQPASTAGSMIVGGGVFDADAGGTHWPA
jgi:hypothetical protein